MQEGIRCVTLKVEWGQEERRLESLIKEDWGGVKITGGKVEERKTHCWSMKCKTNSLNGDDMW